MDCLLAPENAPRSGSVDGLLFLPERGRCEGGSVPDDLPTVVIFVFVDPDMVSEHG
jgi:hypothetical protein